MKIGILGGGQLGRMLQEEGQRWNMPVFCMDKNITDPAGLYKDFFVQGDIRKYEDVMAFGIDKDILTIEIEHVNIEALQALKSMGKEVHPSPEALNIIKNKNRQHAFYLANHIPVPQFTLFEAHEDYIEKFRQSGLTLPCIYKSAEMGYDGKGVRTLRSEQDIRDLPKQEGLFQEKIDIAEEIAVMIVRNPSGDYRLYDPVSMSFDEENHILSLVKAPVDIDPALLKQANELAIKITERLQICGLCAIELFISKDLQLYVNEIAPRPHNSMHISMDNCVTSQFEQHLRGIADLPLGAVDFIMGGTMVNIIGQPGDFGQSEWTGWSEILKLDGVHVHLYGKKEIKPGRKMGHINIVHNDSDVRQSHTDIVVKKFKHKNHGS